MGLCINLCVDSFVELAKLSQHPIMSYPRLTITVADISQGSIPKDIIYNDNIELMCLNKASSYPISRSFYYQLKKCSRFNDFYECVFKHINDYKGKLFMYMEDFRNAYKKHIKFSPKEQSNNTIEISTCENSNNQRKSRYS